MGYYSTIDWEISNSSFEAVLDCHLELLRIIHTKVADELTLHRIIEKVEFVLDEIEGYGR